MVVQCCPQFVNHQIRQVWVKSQSFNPVAIQGLLFSDNVTQTNSSSLLHLTNKGPSSSGAEDPRGGFLTLVTGGVADILESDGKRQLHLYSYSSPTVTRCLILPVLRGPLSGKMKQPVSSSPCWALLAVSQPQRAGRGNERNEEPATLKKR